MKNAEYQKIENKLARGFNVELVLKTFANYALFSLEMLSMLS